MAGVFRSKTLTVAMDCSPAAVYAFVSNLVNLPEWASAFCRSVPRAGDEWIVETPEGEVTIEFAAQNAFGVLDHRVRLSTGAEISVPMRVIGNGRGSEVIITLFQVPGMSDEKFAEDEQWVTRDLESLRRVMESRK